MSAKVSIFVELCNKIGGKIKKSAPLSWHTWLFLLFLGSFLGCLDGFALGGLFSLGLVNTYQFDISDNTLIQDKSQLSFVAMLIDRKTGKIVNAAKSVIDKHDGADVKNLQVEKSRSSVVYTVTGQKVANSSDELAVKILPHGLYIVDGRKIIVR